MIADEEKIRDLSFRALNATEADGEAAVAALKAAIAQYLEEQSDELLLAELHKMNGNKVNVA